MRIIPSPFALSSLRKEAYRRAIIKLEKRCFDTACGLLSTNGFFIIQTLYFNSTPLRPPYPLLLCSSA